MEILVTISEKEILDNSNNFELGRLVREKYLDKKSKKTVDKDLCVICGKETPYNKETHIDFRIGYVEGCGQGCFTPKQCNKNY